MVHLSWWELVNFVLKPFKVILREAIQHYRVSAFSFEPVFDVPEHVSTAEFAEYRKERARIAERTQHRYFILPVIAWLILCFDTLWIMSKNDYDYFNNPMPEMISHRIFPPKFYQQGDMVILTVSTGFFLMSLLLCQCKSLDDRFCMYFVRNHNRSDVSFDLIVNGQVWDEGNAGKIYQFRRRNRQFMWILVIASYIVKNGYFLWNFLAAPFSDLKYHLEMWLYLPILAWYCVFISAFLFYHFFTATKFIMIKQEHLIGQLDDLVHILHRPRQRKTIGITILWSRFRTINRHLAYQCKEIRAYNRFWSKILTVQFFVEMITFCYLLYCLLFYKQTIEQFVYFLFFLIEFGVLIFAVIWRCSLVDHNNDLAYAANMKVCILFQLHFDNVPLWQMTNIDTIATNRNFSRACFRLSNNYRLDSTAFNLAFYIISTFFLMICRRNRRKIVFGA